MMIGLPKKKGSPRSQVSVDALQGEPVAGMQLSTATSLNAANEGLALNKLLALPTGRFTVDEAPLFVPATRSGIVTVELGQYHPASDPPQSLTLKLMGLR